MASSPYTLGGSTGKIWINRLLERDVADGGTNVLTVKAAATASHTVTGSVTVTITEVNDNSPIFNPQQYVARITENIGTGKDITFAENLICIVLIISKHFIAFIHLSSLYTFRLHALLAFGRIRQKELLRIQYKVTM